MWVRFPSPAYARVAQLVERDLAKVEAAGSSPVSRSQRNTKRWYPIGYHLFCVFEPRRGSKVRGLRSAPVVAKRMSTGHSATSRALISKRVHVDIIFVFPIPQDSKVRGLRSAPVVAKRTSTGRSATSRALKETRKNSENTQRILRVFVTRTKISQRKTKCFAY